VFFFENHYMFIGRRMLVLEIIDELVGLTILFSFDETNRDTIQPSP